MARIFTDGAEFGDILAWDAVSNVSATTAQKRSGAYSYLGGQMTKNINNLAEFYVRFGMWILTSGEVKFFVGRHATTEIFYLATSQTTHKLQLYINGVLITSGSNSWNGTTWNLIEVHYKMSDTGNCDVKLNGVMDIAYAGDTKPGADTDMDNIYFRDQGISATYYDDIAINDTTGGSDNSWCGDGHVEILSPNAEGDSLQWTPSSGSTHYTLVDEIPPNSDTDYVMCSGSNAGFRDMYNMGDYSPTGKIIKKVWAEGRAKDNAITGGGVKLGFKTGGTVYLSSASVSLSGNYARVIGDYAATNPFTATSWTESDLDAIQFVIEGE